MVVWKGGRGVKAPYETTHVRVPVPIKEKVEKLVNAYKQGLQLDEPCSFDEAVAHAQKIIKAKKSAKVSLKSLLTAIYGREVNL